MTYTTARLTKEVVDRLRAKHGRGIDRVLRQMLDLPPKPKEKTPPHQATDLEMARLVERYSPAIKAWRIEHTWKWQIKRIRVICRYMSSIRPPEFR